MYNGRRNYGLARATQLRPRERNRQLQLRASFSKHKHPAHTPTMPQWCHTVPKVIRSHLAHHSFRIRKTDVTPQLQR